MKEFSDATNSRKHSSEGNMASKKETGKRIKNGIIGRLTQVNLSEGSVVALSKSNGYSTVYLIDCVSKDDINEMIVLGNNKSMFYNQIRTAVYLIKSNLKISNRLVNIQTGQLMVSYHNLNGEQIFEATLLSIIIAISSCFLSRKVLDGMIVLGDVTVGGTLIKSEDLTIDLKECIEIGADKVMIPISAAVDLATVPNDVLEKVQLIFYSSPEEAVYKALGVE